MESEILYLYKKMQIYYRSWNFHDFLVPLRLNSHNIIGSYYNLITMIRERNTIIGIYISHSFCNFTPQ